MINLVTMDSVATTTTSITRDLTGICEEISGKVVKMMGIATVVGFVCSCCIFNGVGDLPILPL